MFSDDPVTYPLLTEVAYCLPVLRSLTKLCLRSAAKCGNDLIAIGCALAVARPNARGIACAGLAYPPQQER